MADEKTINFRGVDSGVSDALNKMRQTAKETFREIASSAEKYEKGTGSIVKNIEEQIRVLERRNRLESESKRFAAEEKFQQTMEYGAGEKEVEQARVERDLEFQNIANASRAETIQTKILREILDQIKMTSKQEIAADREAVEKQVEAFRSGKLDDETLSAEERLKLETKAKMLDEEKGKTSKGGGGFWQTMFGTAGGVMLGNYLSKIGRFGQGAVTTDTELHMMADLLTTIPFVGGAAAAAQHRHLAEMETMQRAQYSLWATTNREAGAFGGTRFGYDIGETYELQKQILRTRGFGGRGYFQGGADTTLDIQALQRGYGIDQSTLMEILKSQRYTYTNPIQAVKSVIESFKNVWGSDLSEGGDFTRLNELIEFQNSLIQDQSQILESIDYGTNVTIIEAFEKGGFGSFSGDPRMIERIMQVSRGLANPTNEYQQAINYSVLSRINPGASYYQLREMQEKGLAQPGLMSETMKFYNEMYGGGDMFKEAIRQRFGLSYSQGRTLSDMFLMNPDVFSEIGNKEAIEKYLNISDTGDMDRLRESFYGRADEFVPPIEKMRADIGVAFAESAIVGFGTVMEKFGDRIIKDLSDMIFSKIDITGIGTDIKQGLDKIGNFIGIGVDEKKKATTDLYGNPDYIERGRN